MKDYRVYRVYPSGYRVLIGCYSNKLSAKKHLEICQSLPLSLKFELKTVEL